MKPEADSTPRPSIAETKKKNIERERERDGNRNTARVDMELELQVCPKPKDQGHPIATGPGAPSSRLFRRLTFAMPSRSGTFDIPVPYLSVCISVSLSVMSLTSQTADLTVFSSLSASPSGTHRLRLDGEREGGGFPRHIRRYGHTYACLIHRQGTQGEPTASRD